MFLSFLAVGGGNSRNYNLLRLSVSQRFGLNVWNLSVSKQDALGQISNIGKKCNLSLTLYATNEAPVW